MEKLGILPSPAGYIEGGARNFKYVRNTKKDVKNMKKYVKIRRKYEKICGKYKQIYAPPIHGPWTEEFLFINKNNNYS